jgi:hypothetical protein
VFGKVGGRGDGELEKLGEGFRETNKSQADPFGFLVHILFFVLDDVVSGGETTEEFLQQ